MALDRSGEALALRGAGDLDGLALGELGDGQRVADLQLTIPLGLRSVVALGRSRSEVISDAAELDELARRRRAGLLVETQSQAVQTLLGDLVERKLHGVVTVAVGLACRPVTWHGPAWITVTRSTTPSS